MLPYDIDCNLVYPLEDRMLEKGLLLVSTMLRDIFQDASILQGELCVVFNDPSFGMPMLTTSSPLGIRLCIQNPYDVCLLVSQLGHELTHYIFRKYKQDKDKIAWRYEEIVAEAVALYLLHITPLYTTTLSFDVVQAQLFPACHARKYAFYAQNQMPILTKVSKLRWSRLESNSLKIRERHFKEVLSLFHLLVEQSISLKEIIDYTPYLKANRSIDFEKWLQDSRNPTIEKIQHLQPRIE